MTYSVEKITFEDLTSGLARLHQQYTPRAVSTNPFISAPQSSGVETLAAACEVQQRWPTVAAVAPTRATPSAGVDAPDHEDLPPVAVLKRAVSCDSVCSDTSVNLENLEESNTTGYLCVGLEYDR